MSELVIFSKFQLGHLNLDLAPTRWLYVTLINNYWIGAGHDTKNYPDRGQCYLPKPKV